MIKVNRYSRKEYSTLNKTERVNYFYDTFNVMEQVLQNQKEKLCHMSFSINRAEAFIDFLLSATKFIPTPDEVREINQVAIDRTNEQFPSMPIQLVPEEEKVDD